MAHTKGIRYGSGLKANNNKQKELEQEDMAWSPRKIVGKKRALEDLMETDSKVTPKHNHIERER